MTQDSLKVRVAIFLCFAILNHAREAIEFLKILEATNASN